MVAGRRLEALLEQAIDAQLRRCMFHNNHRVAVSLLTDYVAGAEQIPTRTVQARHFEDSLMNAPADAVLFMLGVARHPVRLSRLQ